MGTERGTGRRLLIIGLGAVIVVAGVVVAILLSRGQGLESGTPSPQATDDLPVPDRAEAGRTLTYLDTEAPAVLVMHRAAVELAADLTPERCDRVATALERDAPPGQALLEISGVPDEPLRTALEAERLSLGVTVTACLDGTAPSGDVVPLREATASVQARLDALKAAR